VTDPADQDDIIRPAFARNAELGDKPKTRGDFYSRLVFGLSAILAVAAMIASAIGFAGFAENDTGFWHLVTAFILCFGVGALAYIPLAIISLLAKWAIWVPLTRMTAILIILVILPWLPFAFYLSKAGEVMTKLSIAIVITVLFILFWAARYLRARKA